MSGLIDPVGAVGAADALTRPVSPVDVSASPGVDFGRWLVGGLERVNSDLLASQVEMQRLAAGEPVELHRLMLQLEESRMGLQLVLQVRNRLLEAYQDVMRMQV